MPGTATTASASANTMNVRWVPISGISSSAARNVPTSEPTVEIAYSPPVVRPVSARLSTINRFAYGATVPSSATGTATSTSTATREPRNAPTESEPRACTERRRNGPETNGTIASSTPAASTITHSPRMSARRSAIRPPSA